MHKNIAIFGSSGAIGNAFLRELLSANKETNIFAFSSSESKEKYSEVNYQLINYKDENSIANAADLATKNGALDLVIVATGILHDEGIFPEKSLRDLSAKNFQHLFEANTVFPALVAKYFLPRMNKENSAIFAALSARVGSISDNRLGGWYAYRSSKAALNMIIKTASIEIARTNKKAIVVGLHPGTVNSKLSKPFQKHVEEGGLFSPSYSAQKLLSVLFGLKESDSGRCFAWDGKEIKP